MSKCFLSAAIGARTNRTTDYDRYETPEVLATDRTLSAVQKLARLEAWEEDLKAGMRASDESVTSIKPGLSGTLLQRVVSCLEQVRSAGKPDRDLIVRSSRRGT